ncbi:MAG: hypothetical protein QM775_18060 [Pirellulales bacterium]
MSHQLAVDVFQVPDPPSPAPFVAELPAGVPSGSQYSVAALRGVPLVAIANIVK